MIGSQGDAGPVLAHGAARHDLSMLGDVELGSEMEPFPDAGFEGLESAGGAFQGHPYRAFRLSSSRIVGRETNGMAPPR